MTRCRHMLAFILLALVVTFGGVQLVDEIGQDQNMGLFVILIFVVVVIFHDVNNIWR